MNADGESRDDVERRRREGLERVRAACAARGIVLDPQRLATLEPWLRGEITLDEWYARSRAVEPDDDATGRVR